jgi:DNA-binding PadR family transcriptional regulator
MSIRHGLLALLERGPMYGYQLRAAFEASTGGAWRLNIGQVYTTLARLERDGMVRPLPGNDAGQRPYGITETGRAELSAWFATPVTRAARPRDELAIKLTLALTSPRVDQRRLLAAQRAATMGELRELNQARLQVGDDPARRLALDALMFHAEAEIRWLDHCETSVLPQQVQPTEGGTAASDGTVGGSTPQSRPTPEPTSRPTR